MRSTQLSLAVLAWVLLAAAGCSREAQHTAQQPEAATDANPITTETWVDDVQLTGVGATAADQDDSFTVGEPLELSMRIDQAPDGTQVTAYWYGPDNVAIAYETKSTVANERRVTFTQDNTHFWGAGNYRAEIWIGDEKVEEESFEIVAG